MVVIGVGISNNVASSAPIVGDIGVSGVVAARISAVNFSGAYFVLIVSKINAKFSR